MSGLHALFIQVSFTVVLYLVSKRMKLLLADQKSRHLSTMNSSDTFYNSLSLILIRWVDGLGWERPWVEILNGAKQISRMNERILKSPIRPITTPKPVYSFVCLQSLFTWFLFFHLFLIYSLRNT